MKREPGSLVSRSAGSGRPHRPLLRRIYAAGLNRLARWFGLKVLFIYRRPLAADQDVPADVDGRYAFRELGEDELLQLADDPAMQLSREFISDAAKRGDICFGVLCENRLVAYRWYSFSGVTPCEDGLFIRYAHPGRAYGYKAFTHPEHRGKRLHLRGMKDSDSRLSSRGCTHTVGYIATHNFASLRANSRLRGVKIVGVISYVRILGHWFIVRSAGAAENDVSIVTQT